MSAQRAEHLDLLKTQVDAGAPDFSVFVRECGSSPSESDYQAAVRYAHQRYHEGLDHVFWMCDRIDRARQQHLLNIACSERLLLSVEDLAAAKMERISSESWSVRKDLEVWIQLARKSALQAEIRALVEAKRMVAVEKDRLDRVWEDASRAEKTSRPGEKADG